MALQNMTADTERTEGDQASPNTTVLWEAQLVIYRVLCGRHGTPKGAALVYPSLD